jgi:nitrogenase molybdenum-iron protein alpha/beta subunit
MKVEFDGTLGAIIASEGMGCTTIINGPGGCRLRAQLLIRVLVPDYEPESECCLRTPLYGKQSRLPCTYLTGEDAVYGAESKVRSAVDTAREIAPERQVTVIDTLATSLMCTNPCYAEGATYVTDDLSSMSFAEGYDVCATRILENLELDNGHENGTVCLLGYGLMDFGWTAGLKEIIDLLAHMGVKVVSAVGCMNSPDELKACSRAEFSVLIDPARSNRTASYLRDAYGVIPLVPSTGAPVGWDATVSFLKMVGDALGKNPDPAIRIVEMERARVRRRLLSFNKELYTFPGRCFDVDGPSAVALPLTRWLIEDLHMVPRKISLLDSYYGKEIGETTAPFAGAERPDYTLGAAFVDGIEANEARLLQDDVAHVEIRPPTARPLNLQGRTLIGPAGCRYIIDETINSARRFCCGQPSNVDDR